MKFVGRIWRSIINIACFSAFGLGGAILSVSLFPLLAFFPGNKQQKHARARLAVGFFFRLLVRILTLTGCMRLEITGLERLKHARGALVLANHPTYIDVVILLSLMPEANCLVKGELWRNPFYWGVVRSTGYIQNTSPEGAIEACADALRSDESLILFPEGTRTIPGKTLNFKRGAAHVALRSRATVIPVLLNCAPLTLAKGAPWWLAPERPFTFSIVVQQQVPFDHFASKSENFDIGSRHFTEAIQDHFCRELNTYGYA